MKLPRPTRFLISRSFLVVLIIALVCAFGFTAFKAVNNIVSEQSQIQQRALTPVYTLVNQELLKPLHIAESFAEIINFDNLVDAETLDEATLIDRLSNMQERLGLIFFVALDIPRKQYMSNGRVLNLIEGEVYWYFEALETQGDVLADLGQVGDVHLFFDVKIYSDEGQFLGFVGVGKRIQIFVEQFEAIKQEYGYDFLFVNERDEVVLSSFPNLVVTDEFIPPLNTISGFDTSQDLSELDGVLVNIDDSDYLVSQISIDELKWRLLVLAPLQTRQTTITRTFVTNALMTFSVVASILAMTFFILLLYKQNYERTSETDALTGLPNRRFINRQFQKLQRQNTGICVVICDLDHFKQINDKFGHNAGDAVLKVASNVLSSHLRNNDIVGRWGGEEFVMLIPSSSADVGQVIAERTRLELESTQVDHSEQTITVTASFGIAFTPSKSALTDLIGQADAALYIAKSKGRNRVELHSP